MGIAISSIYVALFNTQLLDIEAEATRLMSIASTSTYKRTNNQTTKSSNKTLTMPNKDDFYYEQSVGIKGDDGSSYAINPQNQNYKSIATDKGSYINLVATKTSQGSTLNVLGSETVSDNKVGEYPFYDMETAVSEGIISQDDCDKLIEAAIHSFAADMGVDDFGDLKCTADYIKENYNIVKLGDNQFGLVSKSAKTGEKASIYKINESGEYQEPKVIQAYNLKMDTKGNITGFKDSENNDVELTTKKVFDQEAYDAAMSRWNSQQNSNDSDDKTDTDDSAYKADADLETRLAQLSTMRTVISGFLESAKTLAKDAAERSGKLFGS